MKIIKKSKFWFSISSILVLISLSSLVINFINYWEVLNYWIDFKWWTMMELHFEKEVSKDLLQETTNNLAEKLSPVIQSIWNNWYIIRTKEMSNEVHKKFISDLKLSLWTFSEPQFTSIWPSIWKAMKENAFIALWVALIAIILFIAFSFRNLPDQLSSWKFWLSAIVALAHDVIITIWVFSIMWIIQWIEIDTLFITALLTVMWFSVHDTIVVFDRIRENIHKKVSWDDFSAVWEKSIKQTMSRSINTSISTLLPLFALYLFWSDSISMFVLALIVWITIWTYSSIFLATPFLIFVSSKWELGNIKEKK